MKFHYLGVFILIFIFFNSCERFDDNRRILVKGQLTNTEILSDNDFQVFATFDNFLEFDFDNENLLGQSIISPDGTFDFIIPAPNDDVVYIQINPTRDSDTAESNKFTSLIVMVPEIVVDTQELIDVNQFELAENAFINLEFNKVSTEPSSIFWQLSYKESDCIINFENILENTIPEICDFNKMATDLFQDENESVRIKSELGSVATLSYTINDGITQTVNIPLDNVENEFEIEY